MCKERHCKNCSHFATVTQHSKAVFTKYFMKGDLNKTVQDSEVHWVRRSHPGSKSSVCCRISSWGKQAQETPNFNLTLVLSVGCSTGQMIEITHKHILHQNSDLDQSVIRDWSLKCVYTFWCFIKKNYKCSHAPQFVLDIDKMSDDQWVHVLCNFVLSWCITNVLT